jgi:hypothetical protein
MPAYQNWDDDDDELYDPVDADDDEEPTSPCPSCQRLIHEEADACPYCGEYLSGSEAHGGSGRPAWITVAAMAALAGTVFFFVLMLFSLLG